MNQLPAKTRAQILTMLCEGVSMRSASRIADVSINTVVKLLVQAGVTCMEIHDELVRNVPARRVECDEIWAFCYAKQRNVKTAKSPPAHAGDVWTWTAIDPETKLVISWLAADRSAQSAMMLMFDLQRRLANRVQLTTDGHKAYLKAVEEAFGADIDYAQLVKIYGEAPEPKGRYSPPAILAAERKRIEGRPDPDFISTSMVERQNLNMRMSMRRFTRLTNGFSKRLVKHIHALALYHVFHNFVRIHTTLRTSPAMAAGIAESLWSMHDVVRRIDQRFPGAHGPRGPYRKRGDSEAGN